MKKKLLVLLIAAIPMLMLNIASAQFGQPVTQCTGLPNGSACSGGTCSEGTYKPS